jgi:NADH-quinone oxidoreductase subunit J
VSGESAVFWVSGAFAVFGALGMVVSRKAVHSALWVAFAMINIAILYFSLEAPFLGTTQIVVYTGAVMMLFLFVLMIVGVDSSDSLLETIKGQRLLAIIIAFSFGGTLVAAIASTQASASAGLSIANANSGGHLQAIARVIFRDYLFAFEATSALLITAAMGAMILAHNERWAPRKTQDQLQRERTLGNHITPMPAPGVLARNNSVDTPGLLPDGSISADSLPNAFRGQGVAAQTEAIEEGNK